MKTLGHTILASITLLAISAGCSSDPSKQSNARPTRDDPSKGIICTNEVPTGSTLRVRKCTTPEEREAQQRDSEHQIQIAPVR